MTAPDLTVARLLIDEARRRLIGESLPRLRRCLAEMTDEEIWWRPNEASNSAGNLVLHLCGNARQWILGGLGGAPDRRDRDAEFAERGPVAREELLGRLESTMAEIDALLGRLDPADLARVRPVQCYEESGVAILVHVVEHFSYHVGQIGYALKARKAIDLGYYAGHDLTAHPE